MQLFEIPENPTPPGAEVSEIVTRDRVRLRAARWAPALDTTKEASRGTVLLFHGRSEFIEKYFEVVGDLTRRGFHVATFDWRGQGASQRLVGNPRKGHVGDFSEYGYDLEAFFNQMVATHCPRPWFGLAHSMGGAILVDAVHEGRVPLSRLVLSAPLMAIQRVTWLRATRMLAASLGGIGFSRAYIPGGRGRSIMAQPFEGNPLTSDPVRFARFARLVEAYPALAIGDPTIGWLRAAFRHMARFTQPRYALELKVPVLPVAAGADTIVSTPAIERFASRLKSGPAIVIAHARHELLMERDVFRDQFMAAFDAFVPGSEAAAGEMPPSLRLQA